MKIRMLAAVAAAALAALAVPAVARDAHEAPKGPTADAAVKMLKDGNARFVQGKAQHPHAGVKRAKETASGQSPFAIVLGCSDSRTPPEVLFDQGIGDLFVVRVAGNVAEEHTLGSIEYAAEHLGSPVIVVLGHHKCGAVKATAEGAGTEGNLGALVKEIRPGVEEAKKAPGKEGLVHDAVHAHAKLQATAMTAKSPVLKKLVDEGKVKVVTAVYDLDTGTIDWN